METLHMKHAKQTIFPADMDRQFRSKELYDRFGEWIDRDGKPHLPALLWADNVITIWCQHCQAIHTHSTPSGHRVAHCHQWVNDDGSWSIPSPYERTGYYLEIVGVVNTLEVTTPRRTLHPIRNHSLSSQPDLSPKERFEVLVQHHFRCFYCGKSPSLDGITLEIDHIEPKSKGGSHAKPNRVPACQSCNRGKGAREIL